MQTLVKYALYIALAITGLTAFVTLAGIVYLWTFSKQPSLPYLEWLIGAVILELSGVAIVLAKRGLKYLPETRTDKERTTTLEFMADFISSGTSATIVTHRASWLAADTHLQHVLRDKLAAGTRIEIITPNPVENRLHETLLGASFIVTREQQAPESRFTLINGDRSGAEKLAIARGVYPEHEITIFDNYSGPQIVAMAKDIVRKSKALSDAE